MLLDSVKKWYSTIECKRKKLNKTINKMKK